VRRRNQPPSRERTSKAATHEFRLQGRLELDWAAWFEGVDVTAEDEQTVLRIAIADQSALYGVLTTLRDLGFTLLSVNTQPPNPEAVEGSDCPRPKGLERTGQEVTEQRR
jgi:hypothetical protein